MDALLAARLQMTLSLAFHMVFAAVGIGLPLMLVVAEGLYLRTGREHYLALAKKWAKVTGLLFAVGAVSGTALSIELGLLWPQYMKVLGAVVGHIFALEGYAFFLEAIFIGLYLYGWDRLSAVAHWLCGVAIATTGMLSGVLVLGVNAWMQLPVGFEMSGDRVTATDPIAIFKQPLWVHMAVHSTLACYAAVAFAAAGWYAWQARRGRRDEYVRSGLAIAMSLGAASALLQPISGDLLAKFVYKTQPVKFAAMEGHFRTERNAPLRIGGWPNEETRQTPYAIEIPGALSILAAGSRDAEVVGLDQTPRDEWPNVRIVHIAFQIMVGCGAALAALSLWYLASWLRTRTRPLGEGLLARRKLLAALVLAAPLGFIALEAGWFVTEVGRQPWIIQYQMRTADAVTPARGVPTLFYMFTALYLLLATTVVVLLRRLATSEDGQPTERTRAEGAASYG